MFYELLVVLTVNDFLVEQSTLSCCCLFSPKVEEEWSALERYPPFIKLKFKKRNEGKK